MSEPTSNLLRETKIGQKGFVKDDVMTYLDELNTKLTDLENENKALKENANNNNNSQEIDKYKIQSIMNNR